jgi:hypothetical protein
VLSLANTLRGLILQESSDWAFWGLPTELWADKRVSAEMVIWGKSKLVW